MIIQSKIKPYNVDLVLDLPIAKENADINLAFFVVDKNVYRLYPQLFHDIPKERLYILEAIEQNKTIETALDICEKITEMNAKRNLQLVSYGGGIIQDLTGFVANILYRGIHWLFVPTTLLAACDSCIGSKTSLNYKQFKNLLGTFYPPNQIIICPEFFNTLTVGDFQSGMGEVVKFNVMSGLKSIENLEQKETLLLAHDKATINEFIQSSHKYKKLFIEEDEFDQGKRILLNFAHTFGHALEVSSSYNIPHGTAVAIGMLMANEVSVQRGILSKENAQRVIALVKPIITLEIKQEWFSSQSMIEAIRKDKKQTGKALTAILLNNNFDLLIVQDLKEEELVHSIAHVLALI